LPWTRDRKAAILMCGRFSLSGEVDFYAEYFGTSVVATEALEPSWNVAPTDDVYVVAQRIDDGGHQERALRTMRWGLIPHWAKEGKSININARAETVATTPAFRDSFSRKRCLIPADGFYEWEGKDKGRAPHWVFRADGYPVGFAGVWSSWNNPADGKWVRSCAIITTAATGVISSLHDRMPVALLPEAWEPWLDRALTDPEEAADVLAPIEADLWMEREVSTRVNNVRNNGPELQGPPDQQRLL
jgi:putative SOS response-associated peptidase YedK